MKKDPRYSVVLSDLHFGDSRCSLHSMATVRAFVDRLQNFKPLTEIILLGDILDLQLANWAQAVEGKFLDGPRKRAVGFRYFINHLLHETGCKSVIYVPGNHDYRVFDYHSIEKSLLKPLHEGKKLSGKISFFRSFSPSFLQGILAAPEAKITVVYPHHSMIVNGTRIVLTHGHFFDPTQAFNHEIGKVFSKTQEIPKKDIHRIRNAYFRRVSFYQTMVSGLSVRRELRDWFNSIYQPVTELTNRLHHRARKTFLTPAMKRSLEQYVRYCCRSKKVEGVIFGHTHHAGKIKLNAGRVRYVWNSGTFLRESKDSPRGSFLTIGHNGVTPVEEAIEVHVL
jgi:UDP-2,3-diacylglucosamine pyrophosphatase LpxH